MASNFILEVILRGSNFGSNKNVERIPMSNQCGSNFGRLMRIGSDTDIGMIRNSSD